jgi:hypothetical protein
MLRVTGADIFRDEDSIPPGKKWRIVLQESLRESDIVLVFWSEHSSQSKEVEAEYQEAVELNKDIIPVLLDESSLPPTLSEFQYIDFKPLWVHAAPFEFILGILADQIRERITELFSGH